METGAVTFVIVSWNARDRIDQAIESVVRQGARVIVVDNASGDGTAAHVAAAYAAPEEAPIPPGTELGRKPEAEPGVKLEVKPGVTLIEAGANLGFPAAANLGIAEALADPACRYVGLLNDDAWLGDGWLAAILPFAEGHPEGAGFQGVTLDARDPSVVDSVGLTIGHAGRAIQLGYRSRQPAVGTGEVFGVNAAAALYSRAFLEAQPFGGEVLDAGLGMYLEDVDLAARSVLLGWRNYVVEGAVAYHLGSGGDRERRPATVRLNSRNEVLVAVKNLPWRVVARSLPEMAHAELARLRDYLRDGDRRAARAAIAGRTSALRQLPPYLRKRRALDPYRAISPQVLWERMGAGAPQPVAPPPGRPPRGSLQDAGPAAESSGVPELPGPVRAVVVHYNTPALAAECVATLLASGAGVTVVDNGSRPGDRDDLRRRLEGQERVELVELGENRGFGAGVNAGVRALGPDYDGLVLVVNPDMRAEPGAVALLAGAVTAGVLDIACPAVYSGSADQRAIYFTGGSLDRARVEADHWDYGLPFIPERGVVACGYIAGASFLLARATWERLGGFPEELFLYWEDAALSFRAGELGLRTGVVREARMWHAVGAATSRGASGASRSTYYYTCRNRFLVSKAWGVTLGDLLAGPAAGPTYRWPLRALVRERRDRLGRSWAALRGTLDGAAFRAGLRRGPAGRGPY